MTKKTIILSSSGLRNVVINNITKEEEFLFIFGEKEIKLQKLFAEFISPTVSHLHQCDPTINSIDFNKLLGKSLSKKSNLFQEVFNENTISQIIQLSQGYSIEIAEKKDKEIRNLLRLSIILGNEELYTIINNTFNKKQEGDQRKNEIFEQIQIYHELYQFLPKIKYQLLIDEIAEQISSKDEQKLKLLPKSILYLILKSDHFNFDDSDVLINIINQLFSKSDPYDDDEIKNINNFYELVDFSKLTPKNFNDIISKIDYTQITGQLWQKICKYIYNNQQLKEESIERNIKIDYDGNSDHLFEGIIHHLSRGKNKNIHDLGIINVSSPNDNSNHPPKNAVDFGSRDYFYSHTGNNYDSWLEYDFKNMRICPTSYSIKTSYESDSHNPVNWRIEVSNTGNKNDWKTIDLRVNASCVSKANQSYNYTIEKSNKSYRFIRLKQTGPTSGRCYDLAISCLEYFGTLEMA